MAALGSLSGFSAARVQQRIERLVPSVAADAPEFMAAVADNAYSGDYPLARFLYLSVNYKPGSDLDDLRREFVRFVFSHDGQEAVVKDGYLPVPATVCAEELRSVGIAPTF